MRLAPLFIGPARRLRGCISSRSFSSSAAASAAARASAAMRIINSSRIRMTRSNHCAIVPALLHHLSFRSRFLFLSLSVVVFARCCSFRFMDDWFGAIETHVVFLFSLSLVAVECNTQTSLRVHRLRTMHSLCGTASIRVTAELTLSTTDLDGSLHDHSSARFALLLSANHCSDRVTSGSCCEWSLPITHSACCCAFCCEGSHRFALLLGTSHVILRSALASTLAQ